MSSQRPPDFDALWDYDRTDYTETKFREILLQGRPTSAAELPGTRAKLHGRHAGLPGTYPDLIRTHAEFPRTRADLAGIRAKLSRKPQIQVA